MSNQTDGRRSATKKKHSTTREHLHPSSSTRDRHWPLACCAVPQTPRMTPARASGQGEAANQNPNPARGLPLRHWGATTSSVRNRPRLLVPASVHFDNGHSLSTRPSLSPRNLDVTQCDAIPSPPSPPSAAIDGWLSTSRVPIKFLDRCRRPLHASTPPSQARPSKSTRQWTRTRTTSQHHIQPATGTV